MNITANIEKAFGNELAKIYAETIPEEELKRTAREIFSSLTSYKGHIPGSSLEKEIAMYFTVKIKEEVDSILSSEECKIDVREEAMRVIKKSREKAEEYIVEGTAKTISRLYNADPEGFGLKDWIRTSIALDFNR